MKTINETITDTAFIKVTGHVLIRDITDKNNKVVLVDKKNAIHLENFSQAIAFGISDNALGFIHEMVFGNGASTISGTSAVTYFPPNVTGQSAQLYNQTYRKVVDNMSPLDTNIQENFMQVQHVSNTTFSDIIITCTLDVGEPAGQDTFDTATSQSEFIFDELGLKSFNPIEGNGRLLSHVVFHPLQKSLNRAIEIIYTIRIFMV
jgi:hypothetical protein